MATTTNGKRPVNIAILGAGSMTGGGLSGLPKSTGR